MEAPDPPTVRILHHTARSGGTIISRCLGAMRSVRLLSEIHPLGLPIHHPLEQASSWHGIRPGHEVSVVTPESEHYFARVIEALEAACRASGGTLVIRDWSHLDYHGVPFTAPTYESLTARTLRGRVRLLRFSTVRHPLDQWLSMRRTPSLREELDEAGFLEGALRFARSAVATGFVRYEDFATAPGSALGAICRGLDLEYDEAWRRRWRDDHRVTGDRRGVHDREGISLTSRGPAASEVRDRLSSLPEYARILEALGYES